MVCIDWTYQLYSSGTVTMFYCWAPATHYYRPEFDADPAGLWWPAWNL